MKKSYYSLVALLAAGNGVELVAQQQDSTLVREMTIEKEYTPIVREADKITRMPEVETPQTNKTKIEYAEPSLAATTKREVHTLEVGSVNTSYPFSNKKGYLTLAGGNYLTLKGDFGYRFLDTEKDLLRIDLHHLSSSGKIKFDEDSWGKTRRKLNDDRINLYYRHNFENLQLKTNVGYDYSHFNYYGRGEWGLEGEPGAADYPAVYPSQSQKRFNLEFTLNTLHKQEWDYHIGFGFTGFSQKDPGINENAIAVSLGLGKNRESGWNFYTGLDVNMLVYGGESEKYDWKTDGAFKNVGVVRISPAFKYKNGSQLSAQLGVNADLAFGVGPYVGIAPDFTFNWKMADHWAFYGALTGGISQYSLSNLAKEYRYYYNLHQNRNSYKIADLKLGIQSNAAAGFWFDIYAGMGYTLDEMFLMSNVQGSVLEEKTYWQNSLSGYTEDAFSWHLGVKMKYKFSNLLDLNLRLQHNGWSVKDDGVASYKPTWEIGSGITLRPANKLTFDLTYDIKGGRKALLLLANAFFPTLVDGSLNVSEHPMSLTQSVRKMDNIHQMNLTANYRICEAFTLNASLNNLLFRRQEVYYGMPDPGFNFMIGGTVRF